MLLPFACPPLLVWIIFLARSWAIAALASAATLPMVGWPHRQLLEWLNSTFVRLRVSLHGFV